MSVSTVRTKLRYLLNEIAKNTTDIFTFDTSRVFSLSETNPIAITTVLINDEEISESGNWSYSSTTKKLTIEDSVTLTSGDTVQIDYTIYPNYSNTELESYINSALMFVSSYSYDYFEINDDDINPEPCPEEENLISMVAAILIKPEDKSYRLPDMSINISNRALPKEEKIQRLISIFKASKTGVYGVFRRDILNNTLII